MKETRCSEFGEVDSKEPFVREVDIAEALSAMCEELITDIHDVEPSLRLAIDRFAHMVQITHGDKDQKKMIGAYIKYVLNRGTQYEKTRLVRNLNVRLALHDKMLVRL